MEIESSCEERHNKALHPTAAGAIMRRPRVNAGRWTDRTERTNVAERVP